MGLKREPFQGVLNILRFNWHFYLLAMVALLVLLPWSLQMNDPLRLLLLAGMTLTALMIVVSLAVSYYVYDHSGLYKFSWLGQIPPTADHSILNINAGFDETSELLKSKFPAAELTVCDFYDPQKHTEVSVKRARKAYPPFPGTLSVRTDDLPFPENNFHQCFAILSAHEIRDAAERIRFFRELARVTRPGGQIFVTEHLRDPANFVAYTVGFFHFHSRRSWLQTFEAAGLRISRELKMTPFITTFILEKNGVTP